MLRIVLPFIPALNVVDPVTSTDVRVAVEIVVHVDVDVVVSPARVPTPTSSSPRSADGHSNAE
jgi:hypothetical protein